VIETEQLLHDLSVAPLRRLEVRSCYERVSITVETVGRGAAWTSPGRHGERDQRPGLLSRWQHVLELSFPDLWFELEYDIMLPPHNK